MSAGVRRPMARDLVGRDFARVRPTLPRRRARLLGWLLVATFACGLSLVALRIDILRLRYALGDVLAEEQELMSRLRLQQVEVETLSNPSRLAELARKKGFARPERIVDLNAPDTGTPTP